MVVMILCLVGGGLIVSLMLLEGALSVLEHMSSRAERGTMEICRKRQLHDRYEFDA